MWSSVLIELWFSKKEEEKGVIMILEGCEKHCSSGCLVSA